MTKFGLPFLEVCFCCSWLTLTHLGAPWLFSPGANCHPPYHKMEIEILASWEEKLNFQNDFVKKIAIPT